MPVQDADLLPWLLQYLRSQKFALDNEKHLQEQMAVRLYQATLTALVYREVLLSEGNIIDFKVGDIGIEVKLRCNKRAIYKQIVRYCDTGRLKHLILYTSTTVGLPQQINGVDIYLINPSHAWL